MTALRYASTKIQPPRLRSARVARPRLEEQLAAALRERRVVLLLAPAGFGKTCALAAQFEAEREREPEAENGPGRSALAWISLDEDDDPQRFFACLIDALEPYDPPWRIAPEALLALVGESDAAARRAVAEIVNALAATDIGHGVIVFDDLHRVQSGAVHPLLDALLERLPAQWTVVISTRVEPPLSLARWRAAGELAEFTLHDLRFDAAEATALAATGASAATVTDPAVDRLINDLYERTQGWPAGLRLCLAALRTRPGAQSAASTGRGGRIDHHLFDYIAGEVLDDMPAELHDFLLRCSVLPVLTDSRCAVVSADPRAAERLDEIERRGLFVTALDAPERTLVLHDLFREALDERLRRRWPDELPVLLQRAAQGEPDPLRRIGFLMRASDHAAAERALADVAESLMLSGAGAEVRRAIDQFPAAWQAASTRLQLIRASCLYWSWEWEEMARSAQAAIAAARLTNDDAARHLGQTYLASAWYTMGQHAQSNALLDELRPQAARFEPHTRAMFLSCECSALFRGGEHTRLPVVYAEHLDVLEQGASLFTWWTCSPSSSWLTVGGMRALVERYCRGALLRVGERELEVKADVRMLQAWMLLWSGDVGAALAEAEATAADARWLGGSAAVEGNLDAFGAITDAMRGRAAPIRAMLDRWYARGDNMPPEAARSWHSYIASFAVRVHDVLGSDAAELEGWGRRFADGIPDPATIEALGLQTSCFSARHAAAQGRWADAAALYERVLPLAATMDTLGQSNELHLRAAHAMLAAGRVDAAAVPLRSALERIRREGEQGHALMAGPAALGELAAAAWGHRLDEQAVADLRSLAAWAGRVRKGELPPSAADAETAGAPIADAETNVDTRTRPADKSAGEPSFGTGASALSTREREVLVRIASGDSNKVIARVLDISPHTVKRHVCNILDKLGLSSRGQAAAWLREHE